MGLSEISSDWKGLNAYASANDLIIVYPDIEANLGNPLGCFDSFGYSGEDYLTNKSI